MSIAIRSVSLSLLIVATVMMVDASAQEVALPVPLPTTGEGPVVRTTPPEAPAAATTWVAVADTTAGSPTVAATGPTLRVTAPTAVSVASAAPALSGAYRVRATFHAEAGHTGAYGLTLGGDASTKASPVAFLLQPDRQVSVVRPGLTSALLQDWTPLQVGSDSRNGNDVLEVRVSAAEAVFLVNGVIGARVPLTKGQLDGTVGVHVSAGGDVSVVALTIERAAEVVR